jgi:anti-sigma-K factor RskA
LNGHPQFEEDFDLYAMGALEPEEKQALESHLHNCAECTAKLHEAQGRVAMLALAAPQQNVPAAVKDRLMRQVRAEAPKVRASGVSVFPRWFVPALTVAALALALLAVQLKLENRELRREQADLQEEAQVLRQETERERRVLDLLNATDTVKVTLVSGTAHAVPEGRAFYNPRKGLLFYASNLPVLTADRTYQLWIVPTAGSPISAGVFQVDAAGNGQVMLPALPANVAAKAFAVTLEPSGGVPQPTGPKVLVGLVS